MRVESLEELLRSKMQGDHSSVGEKQPLIQTTATKAVVWTGTRNSWELHLILLMLLVVCVGVSQVMTDGLTACILDREASQVTRAFDLLQYCRHCHMQNPNLDPDPGII